VSLVEIPQKTTKLFTQNINLRLTIAALWYSHPIDQIFTESYND